jgi:hypothetical protein
MSKGALAMVGLGQRVTRPSPSAGERRDFCRPVLRACFAGLALAAVFASADAKATPANLSNAGDVTAFASLIKAYSGASRIGWVVAAPTIAEADSLVASISLRLAPSDRMLIERVRAQTLSESPTAARDAAGPIGWMESLAGRASAAATCSWQVWVADPTLPSLGSGPANIPLAPNDHLPVGSAATMRIGFTGLLQSKIYAFGETKPGAIRDLASAPDVNIPVAGGDAETILLATSRQPAPYLEGIRTALAASGGQRQDLGKEHALREGLLGHGRGIGANIQLVGPNMVVRNASAGASATPRSGELMETCMYSLIPADEASR